MQPGEKKKQKALSSAFEVNEILFFFLSRQVLKIYA